MKKIKSLAQLLSFVPVFSNEAGTIIGFKKTKHTPNRLLKVAPVSCIGFIITPNLETARAYSWGFDANSDDDQYTYCTSLPDGRGLVICVDLDCEPVWELYEYTFRAKVGRKLVEAVFG